MKRANVLGAALVVAGALATPARGRVLITPQLHLVIGGDELTKITSPSDLDSDAKLWGGVSISWSKEIGEAPAEESAE
jgi:hypothetical protein